LSKKNIVINNIMVKKKTAQKKSFLPQEDASAPSYMRSNIPQPPEKNTKKINPKEIFDSESRKKKVKKY